MGRGTQMWAAQMVLSIKRAYPQEVVRLRALIPWQGQAARMSARDRALYEDVLEGADEAPVLRARYESGCVRAALRRAADESSRMLAVSDGAQDDIRYAVDYARGLGMDVTVLPFNLPGM